MTDKPIQTIPVHRRIALVAGLRMLMAATFLMCGLASASSPALAQSLNAARSSGMIGEQANGYAVARGAATAAVRKLVKNVNGKRGKIYAKRAREQKISPAAVGKLYASQIAAKAPKGTWIQSSSGAWRRK